VELQLTAIDSGNASSTTSVRVDPATVDLTFNSNPSGLMLTVGSTTNATPFTKTVVIGSTNSVTATSPQTLGGTTYQFGSWSDGGGQTHVITAPATAASYTATYTAGGTLPDLTGTVTGTGGTPVAGAKVVLTPGGRSTTSDSSGRFTFTGVASGSYTVTASLVTSACAPPASVPVTMSGSNANVTVALQQRADSFGYTCVDGAVPYVAAGTVLSLTGDDNISQVTLPFPVKLYGTSYTTAWVDTNGVLSFANPGRSAVTWNTHIPNTGQPNAAVFPFWDDFVIDAQASIRTAVTGTAPNRQYVVEWRNATFYSNSTARVTAEVQFAESTGAISYAYQGVDADVMEQGNTAVIGLENPAGTVGFEYSYHQAVLRTGNGVTFRPPG
jgi:hypothetical protein